MRRHGFWRNFAPSFRAGKGTHGLVQAETSDVANRRQVPLCRGSLFSSASGASRIQRTFERFTAEVSFDHTALFHCAGLAKGKLSMLKLPIPLDIFPINQTVMFDRAVRES